MLRDNMPVHELRRRSPDPPEDEIPHPRLTITDLFRLQLQVSIRTQPLGDKPAMHQTTGATLSMPHSKSVGGLQ